MTVPFHFWYNFKPLYDVLVEPLGYDALLLEYHGIEYPDPPEAPEKAISAFRTVKGNSYVPHRSESPPPHNTYYIFKEKLKKRFTS
jgi:hypothetical protein